MNTKVLSSAVALAVSMTFGGLAQAATESTETTFEKSTRVDVMPKPVVKEETTSTTTKKGILGREKSQTSSSTTVREGYPSTAVREKSESTTSTTTRDRFPDTSVKSKTTIETQKSY